MARTTTGQAGGIMATVRAYRVYRRTIRELNQMSDYELSDLGVTRNDIRAAARSGSYGR